MLEGGIKGHQRASIASSSWRLRKESYIALIGFNEQEMVEKKSASRKSVDRLPLSPLLPVDLAVRGMATPLNRA